MIMTDQQRFDSLGSYGCSFVKTPNLDRLAAEGVRYTNCYVNNTVCTPSRASIFTGKYLNGHGVYRLHDIMPDTEHLFTSRLKDLDYTTALIGKLHISGRSFERDRRIKNDGFDVYEYAMTPHRLGGKYNSYGQWVKETCPEFYRKLDKLGRNIGHIPMECHFTHWASEKTIDFIRNSNKDKPFFCMMSVVDPHDPYSDYPLEMLKMVDKENIPKPNYKIGESHKKPTGIIRAHEHSYLGNFHNYTEKQIMQMRLGYYASIAFMDREVGKVLHVLEEEGLRDNTIVIFTSDHGDMLGDHELLAKGAFFYEPCVKVPLLIRFPDIIPPGTVINEFVQLHDLPGTILKQAGYNSEEINSFMPDSRDLISLLNSNNTQKYRDYAVCLYRNTSIDDEKLYYDPPIHATMYRTKRYKINVYHSAELNKHDFQGEIYDMREDPLETKNLWDEDEYIGLKNELLGQLMNWLVHSDVLYNSGRGGELFPPKSQWSQNNPL